MPLYDYECISCRTVVEKQTKVEDRSPLCACGSQMKRLPSIGFSYDWFKPQHFHTVGHYCGTQRELYESAKRQNIELFR